ncbi:MAG: nucleoside monophosphate kinase [Candidatus Staskawiczbacteria bacterium]|nr:nucleoside monophosphate kinase [Candidatus Staskawiczbacteria bacterium]MBI3337566.1 nucleoside monophosphate kinase [Candidatus Staskawiczbacteria bacterium]
MEKKIIILFGPPGAGKGTQAELLADKLGYYHFESSKIIEFCFRNEKPEKVFNIEGTDYKVADEIKKWESGDLNSPPFVVFLMTEKIKDLAKDEKSIIFSGSPRTIYEAEKEIPLLTKLYGKENIKFVLLEISAETTIFRNSHRRICELIRHSILFTKETESLKLCPLDGSMLIKRKKLDDPETIKNRLIIYKEQTYPVTRHIEKEGILVRKANGEQSVSDVFKEILEKLK